MTATKKEKQGIDIDAFLTKFKEEFDREHEKHDAVVAQIVDVLKASGLTGWERVQVMINVERSLPWEGYEE